jgi:hypothetical protein
VGETLAARLRAEVVRKAMRSGHYDTSEERWVRRQPAVSLGHGAVEVQQHAC